MKKDVLFLCQFFYPEHNSSATLPFDTASYLAAHGYEVGCMCGYPKEYTDQSHVPLRETVGGVDIRRLRYMQLGRSSKLGRLINYFSFTISALLHVFRLKSYKCVVVFSNPPILPLVALLGRKLFKTKLVFVAYDVYPEVAYASASLLPGSFIAKAMRALNHLLYKEASFVVALTDEMRSFLLANRPELTEDRIVTIANWAHEGKAPPSEEAYSKFRTQPGDLIVSYFGNMGICQEMETLAAAVEELAGEDGISFLFIGHGSKKASLERRFKSKGLKNVQVYDFMTGADLEQSIGMSSCCVVTLERGLKGLCAPSKYYSYLQGGKPVIAVVEEGSYLEREIREKEIGLSINIGDVPSLVDAIRRLKSDPQIAEEMGKRSMALYDASYGKDIGLGKYRAMLESLISSDRAAT